MGKLILDSLEIRNFRGFKHLQIERLGRVNLIVGKSSLLEALYIYAQGAISPSIQEILKFRDESKEFGPFIPRRSIKYENLLPNFKNLFYGRKDIKAHTHIEPIQIGPINRLSDTLSITLNWYPVVTTKIGNGKIDALKFETGVDNRVPVLSRN